MVLKTTNIDLHGYTVEDAISRLQYEIPSAFQFGYDAIMIIHGKGTGILKNEIMRFLRTDYLGQYIHNVMPGDQYDLPGGDGVVKVVFRVKQETISGIKVKPKKVSQLITNEIIDTSYKDIIAIKKAKGKHKYIKRMMRGKR